MYHSYDKLSINHNQDKLVISSSRIGGHIHIHKMERKSQIKYLGVFNDPNLHWGHHIQHINNKLIKNLGMINKLLYYVDVHTLKQLYYSFSYLYLTYGFTSCMGQCL